jgi:hypothetical protein
VNTFSIQVQTARQAPKASFSGIYRDKKILAGFFFFLFREKLLINVFLLVKIGLLAMGAKS